MLPGRQVAEKRPEGTKGQAELGYRHLSLKLPCSAPPNPQYGGPLEDGTPHCFPTKASVRCCWILSPGARAKVENAASPGSLGQG